MKKGGNETMNNDWTNDIRRLMDGYEVKAPDGLLDDVKRSIALSHKPEPVVALSEKTDPTYSDSLVKSRQAVASMSEETAQPGKVVSAQSEKNKAKVVPLWRYRWATAAAVAVIAVPIFWKLMSDRHGLAPTDGSHAPAVASVSHRPAASANGSGTAAPSSSFLAALSSASRSSLSAQPSASRSSLSAQPSASRSIAGQSSASASPLVAQVSAEGSPVDVQGLVGRNNVAANNKDKQARQKKQEKRSPRHGALEPLDSYDLAYEPSSNGRGGAFSLGAYYGGAVGSNSGVGGDMPFIASDAAPYGMYSADMAVGRLNEASPSRKAHHKQPVKAGVSVSYRINNRWSVQSGVTYSYLSSDFTSDNAPKETQKLHYVGVPLTASYNIVKGKKAEMYVTAGGEVEKLVKGKLSSEGRADTDVKEHRPQWSVKAAVGGAYHFTPTLSVYVEPGVSYHFDNHSAVENVYKDKPTNFSLNMGFRVNLNEK